MGNSLEVGIKVRIKIDIVDIPEYLNIHLLTAYILTILEKKKKQTL